MVTNVSNGCLPTRRAASGAASGPPSAREATSASRTTAPQDRSGNVCAAGPGDGSEERAEVLAGLEHHAAELVGRADRVTAGCLTDQLIQGRQVIALRTPRVPGAVPADRAAAEPA